MKRSFTLVELLVVTVIISIIVGAVVPAFTRLMTGNAVSYGLRMTTSQLNMARTEACVRRRYVAVVFLDKASDEAGAYLPADGDNIGYRCAFRSCYVTRNGAGDYTFGIKEKETDSDPKWTWVPGTKWEYLPKGAYFGNLNNLIALKNVVDKDGLFKDTFAHDVSAVIFSDSGRSADKTAFEVEVHEGVVTDNKTVTRNNNADNKLTAKVNRYTGSVRTE